MNDKALRKEQTKAVIEIGKQLKRLNDFLESLPKDEDGAIYFSKNR
jgi:hypothetical protein